MTATVHHLPRASLPALHRARRPAALGALDAARAPYLALGWPVTIDRITRRLLVITGTAVEAISMPALFAEAVLTDLRIALQDGPVLADLADDRWAFLTRCADEPVNLPADITGFGVRLIAGGQPLYLPAGSGDEHEIWIRPPERGREPWPRTAAIGAARRLAYRLSRDHHDERRAVPDLGRRA
ncbi:hypothetical protein [Haloechinothrix halophila]|uniref:hypothetical protein n=1 Tax=Haloechinothrix halophila TaxID=1069073 RepID=UPI00042420E3|nr:hypothetical protein [Haloechinothrix halophila]